MEARRPATDRELIARCLDGDEAAWEQLIARHERLLYSVARRMGLSRPDAEDVFQRVCIRLYHWLPAIREPDRVASWLVVTASREAIRQSRRARRDVPFDPGGDAAPYLREPEDARPRVDDAMLEAERARALAEALDALPERCQALMRAFLDGGDPNYREIAARLSIPVGSIGPYRARCLAHLRRLLRERGFE
jgi:RNA polymerase sigma factor (sigma-70 family)